MGAALSGSTALITNPDYATLFERLGWGSAIAIVDIALVVLIPFLRKLIKDKETPPDEMPVAVVPAKWFSRTCNHCLRDGRRSSTYFNTHYPTHDSRTCRYTPLSCKHFVPCRRGFEHPTFRL